MAQSSWCSSVSTFGLAQCLPIEDLKLNFLLKSLAKKLLQVWKEKKRLKRSTWSSEAKFWKSYLLRYFSSALSFVVVKNGLWVRIPEANPGTIKTDVWKFTFVSLWKYQTFDNFKSLTVWPEIISTPNVYKNCHKTSQSRLNLEGILVEIAQIVSIHLLETLLWGNLSSRNFQNRQSGHTDH